MAGLARTMIPTIIAKMAIKFVFFAMIPPLHLLEVKEAENSNQDQVDSNEYPQKAWKYKDQ